MSFYAGMMTLHGIHSESDTKSGIRCETKIMPKHLVLNKSPKMAPAENETEPSQVQ